ncbi:hypothetical protein PHYBOEH_001687 [Phytophthora boehmeriae]|uniref:Disease resistance R13L4/SHOC-2-like LRR domain-containing protein n=1 Tax=Phytophthora boehmeriae TaxID=109152 RepID=A0A8T1WSL3_9STRA|nr:hypothetical protein PHYBOEH_001687 [Phytophthora boehmeriae]
MDKDEKKWECVDLVKIDLSHNSIPAISDEIAALTSVTSIKICQNALQTLPEGFFDLQALTYLDLSHNQLEQNLSERFGALTSLKELMLSGNKLSCLPNSIGLLENLESLHVEENALSSLPEQIGSLRKLHVLVAHTNQLTTLPTSFGALRNMQNLDLKKNHLESTGNALSTLSGLKFLDLRQNKLVLFPVLPESAALDQVFLGYNTLSSIDENSILCIKDSVTVLDMRDNKLQVLPANLACLYRLKTLDVANNDLTDLPPGLGYLKHLNHFIVDGNPLRAIRRSVISSGRIYDAPQLASLSFENNSLTKVPCELGLCPNLRAIYMNGNPQRTVRGAVIAKGSTEILTYLKNKLPPNAALPPPSPISRIIKTDQVNSAKMSSTREKRSTSGNPRSDNAAYAAHGMSAPGERPAPVAPIENFVLPTVENSAIDVELAKLSAQIVQLESQLESPSLSAPKRFALKKELAVVRSKKIREERKIK